MSKSIDILNKSISEHANTIKIELSCPHAPGGINRVSIRPIFIRKKVRYNFLYHNQNKDIVKNFMAHSAKIEAGSLLNLFEKLVITNIQNEVTIDLKHDKISIKRVNQINKKVDGEHNRKKNYLIDSNKDFLKLLKISSIDGNVISSMYSKYRQINKFIELLDDAYSKSTLKTKKELKVVDMASGKGYLTFALHDYLTKEKGLAVNTTGIDVNKELTEFCNNVSHQINTKQFLKFENKSIFEFTEDIDILIALHACDTATDDAIKKGLEGKAKIIVLSPCCHKELRRQIVWPDALKTFSRHGIIKNEMSEILTDIIRSLVLEISGYKTSIIEFIDISHTGKNKMIIAIKNNQARRSVQARKELAELKKSFLSQDYYLEKLVKLQ